MVAVIDSVRAEVPQQRRRWLVPVVVVASVVVIAAVAVGVHVWRYKYTYPAIRDAGFGGPYHDSQQAVVQYDTDLGTEIYVRGPVGTRVQWIFGIANDGSRNVTVLKPVAPGPIANFQWSERVVKAGGDGFGEDRPLQNFPATIRARQSIRVVVTIKKPRCGGSAGYSNLNETPIQWRVAGGHRSTAIDMFGPETLVPCPRYVR